jgi:hypothetical protein
MVSRAEPRSTHRPLFDYTALLEPYPMLDRVTRRPVSYRGLAPCHHHTLVASNVVWRAKRAYQTSRRVSSDHPEVPWFGSLGLIPGSHPWVSSLGLIPGSHPWVSSLGLIPGSHPWVSSLGLIPGSHPWVSCRDARKLLYHPLHTSYACCCVPSAERGVGLRTSLAGVSHREGDCGGIYRCTG